MRLTALLLLTFVALIGLNGCGPTLLLGGATAVKVIHDRRTPATQLEDQTIEIKSLSAFLQARSELGRSHINVTSYNNVALLSGEVERQEIKQWAEEVVRAIDGVRFVHNDLAVAPPSAWTSRGNDAWLTTKAKASLVKISNLPDSFDPTRIKVVTERGVVYLFGLVTEQEGNAATEVIRQLDGVQQVVKLFEYIGAPAAAPPLT